MVKVSDPDEKTNPNNSPNKFSKLPVFSDPKKRRMLLVSLIFSAFVITLVLWIVGFSLSMYFVEKMQGDALAEHSQRHEHETLDVLFGELPTTQHSHDREVAASGTQAAASAADPSASCPETPGNASQRIYAYLPYWPEWGYASLSETCSAIDVLMPEWYELDLHKKDLITFDLKAEHQLKVKEIIDQEARSYALMPVVNITHGDTAGIAFGTEAADDLRRHYVKSISDLVTANGFSGICLNPHFSPANGIDDFTQFLDELRQALKPVGAATCLVSAKNDTVWQDPKINAAADLIVVLAFNEPAFGDPPGPVEAQGDFENLIQKVGQLPDSSKLVLALGNFGYDWVAGQAAPEQIGYAETMRRVARFGGEIEFAPEYLNTSARYIDAYGNRHTIWLLDAVSFHNQVAALRDVDLAGVAIWSLGYDDPGTLELMSANLDLADVQIENIQTIRLKGYVGYEGVGAFRRVLNKPQDGRRNLTKKPGSDLIVQQDYAVVPQPFTLERFGYNASNVVALTFDDGPDAVYTAQILDILKEKNVPAAFFLVGSNIMKNPDVVRRMVDEGHEIGSHTFTHVHIDQVSNYRSQLELSATQRLIVGTTGRRTVLFRTPYGRGQGPAISQHAHPMMVVSDQGYVIVGSEIVPPDWKGLPPQELIDFVELALSNNEGNVIVFHDSGGNRASTVAALPQLIDQLRADGFEVVSLATLLGTDRETLMPIEVGSRATLDGYSFAFLSALGDAVKWMFWIVITAGVFRSLSVLTCALFRRHYPAADTAHTPSVTALIPAYNEEKVILNSIATVLASDYPDLKVIVVDDGSQDGTYDLVENAYGNDPRVTLIHQENQGKWKALNTALGAVDTEIVVAVDADTVLLNDAIRKLVRAFADPRVGAVAGNVRVGNQNTILTKLQALEYITAQNIDRRAAEFYGGNLVVPGAIGAWRVDAVRKAGLYSNQTMTEDADLTVSVLRAGFRVVFEENAFSITEVPETLRAFMKQRLRWTFGMMQTAWKHKGAALERRSVGLISIPDLWVFGVLFPLLAPVADLVLLGTILDALIDWALGRPVFKDMPSRLIVAGYLLLPLLDLILALIAFRFESNESKRLLLLLPLQRFYYRQIQYFTTYRAVTRALTGRIASWGRQLRVGTVRLPEEP